MIDITEDTPGEHVSLFGNIASKNYTNISYFLQWVLDKTHIKYLPKEPFDVFTECYFVKAYIYYHVPDETKHNMRVTYCSYHIFRFWNTYELNYLPLLLLGIFVPVTTIVLNVMWVCILKLTTLSHIFTKVFIFSIKYIWETKDAYISFYASATKIFSNTLSCLKLFRTDNITKS